MQWNIIVKIVPKKDAHKQYLMFQHASIGTGELCFESRMLLFNPLIPRSYKGSSIRTSADLLKHWKYLRKSTQISFFITVMPIHIAPNTIFDQVIEISSTYFKHTLFDLLTESVWSPISFRRFCRAALWNSLRSSSFFTAAAAALRTGKEMIPPKIKKMLRRVIRM